MNSSKLRADSIFVEALDKARPEERSAYLDQACGSDRELRQRVERLLAAQPRFMSFLEAPAPGLAAHLGRAASETIEKASRSIGPNYPGPGLHGHGLTIECC